MINLILNPSYFYPSFFIQFKGIEVPTPVLNPFLMHLYRLFTLLFCIVSTNMLAQQHDYIWLWGYDNTTSDTRFGGMNMDFHFQPPLMYPQKKKINMGSYCGVCSDSTGHLAFYSNGISIRDTTHNKMINGDTINPVPLWYDWQNDRFPNGPFCFALPDPAQPNRYYFLHVAGQYSPAANAYVSSPFYWTLIDMNANNGLGEVLLKNQILIPEGDLLVPVAVKHGNGRDWWVITGIVGEPVLYTFLLDPTGIHGPFETPVANEFPGPGYISANAMSPDGRTYVRCDGINGLHIYDFDRCSGTFSNLRVVPFGENVFGFASVFAPDSRHLYISSWEMITVIDIQAPDISATFDTLAYFDGFASPQEPFLTGFWYPNVGPDSKIYYATLNSTFAMHMIHRPDLPGHAADVEQHGLTLPKINNGTMCLFPNYRLGEWEGSPCDTLNGGHPGDGFTHLPYLAPPGSPPEGYRVLAPLGKPRKPGSAPQVLPLSPLEIEMKRRKE